MKAIFLALVLVSSSSFASPADDYGKFLYVIEFITELAHICQGRTFSDYSQSQLDKVSSIAADSFDTSDPGRFHPAFSAHGSIGHGIKRFFIDYNLSPAFENHNKKEGWYTTNVETCRAALDIATTYVFEIEQSGEVKVPDSFSDKDSGTIYEEVQKAMKKK